MSGPAVKWNKDAERAVLGAVLLRGDAFDQALLGPGDFLAAPNHALWQAFGRLRREGKAIDPHTVGDELERIGKLEAVGGYSALSDLMTHVATADNVHEYAAIVRRDSLTRRIHREAQEALGSGLEGEELLGRLLEAATRAGSAMTDQSVLMEDLVADHFRDITEQLLRKERGETNARGLTTGFSGLDRSLSAGGLSLGLTVLGGRPSHGKSAFARSVADHVSAKNLGGVHVFSLEDDLGAYADRAIADHAGLDLMRLGQLNLRREDFAGITRAADELRRRNWRIDDLAGMSSAQIATRVRRWKREIDTRLVVIDYLQIVREPGFKDRRAGIDHAVGTFADLARTEGLVVLLLSQLTRENAKEKRRPQIEDLRESGEIEQQAKTILFVHQYRADEKSPLHGEVIVGKQKQGKRDLFISLIWDGPTATYRSRIEDERGW